MHFGAAERLVFGDLSGSRFEQRRTRQKYLGVFAHHDGVV